MSYRTKLYLAGPYSKGDPVMNTAEAMRAWYYFWLNGYAPYCPHWSMFQHFLTALPYAEWLEYDNCWIPVMDAVFRLPGESSGADKEVALAKSLGIIVCDTYADLSAKAPPGYRRKK